MCSPFYGSSSISESVQCHCSYRLRIVFIMSQPLTVLTLNFVFLHPGALLDVVAIKISLSFHHHWYLLALLCSAAGGREPWIWGPQEKKLSRHWFCPAGPNRDSSPCSSSFPSLLGSYCRWQFQHSGCHPRGTQIPQPHVLLPGELVPAGCRLHRVSVPAMLRHFLSNKNSIPGRACLSQLLFFPLLAGMDLLSADCHGLWPLSVHLPTLTHSTHMSWGIQQALALTSGVFSFASALTQTVALSALKFCGPNVINHFRCDLPQLFQLSNSMSSCSL